MWAEVEGGVRRSGSCWGPDLGLRPQMSSTRRPTVLTLTPTLLSAPQYIMDEAKARAGLKEHFGAPIDDAALLTECASQIRGISSSLDFAARRRAQSTLRSLLKARTDCPLNCLDQLSQVSLSSDCTLSRQTSSSTSLRPTCSRTRPRRRPSRSASPSSPSSRSRSRASSKRSSSATWRPRTARASGLRLEWAGQRRSLDRVREGSRSA